MLCGTAEQNIGIISGLPKANVCRLRLNTESNSTGFAFHPVIHNKFVYCRDNCSCKTITNYRIPQNIQRTKKE